MAQPWTYLLVLTDTDQQRLIAQTGGGGTEILGDGLSPRHIAQAFDELGSQGWELVGIDPGDQANAYWFKRPS